MKSDPVTDAAAALIAIAQRIKEWLKVAPREKPSVSTYLSPTMLLMEPERAMLLEPEGLHRAAIVAGLGGVASEAMASMRKAQSSYEALAARVKGPTDDRRLRASAEVCSEELLETARELRALASTASHSWNAQSSQEEDEWLPASAFHLKYGIKPDRLDKAARDKRLSRKRIGRFWHYPVKEVRRLWPEDFTDSL